MYMYYIHVCKAQIVTRNVHVVVTMATSSAYCVVYIVNVHQFLDVSFKHVRIFSTYTCTCSSNHGTIYVSIGSEY